MLAPMEGISARAMFGGVGFFKAKLMFALIAFDELYLKIDAETRPHFEAEGCRPFTYEGKHKPMEIGYWTVPERLYDDADAFLKWAERAFDVAVRSDAAKPPSQRKYKPQYL